MNDIRPWMRYTKKDDMTLGKGILMFVAIALILSACVYVTA